MTSAQGSRTPGSPSLQAQAILDVLIATSATDDQGRLISTETLYSFLRDRFGMVEADARVARTIAVRELTDLGLVRRLSVRGPGVEVLTGAQAGSAVPYEVFAATAAVDGDLDAPRAGSKRVEQAFLRRVLLGGRADGACTFCGRQLPAGLLVAAHVRPRAGMTRDERLRFRQAAVLACRLGCDALWEDGWITADEDLRLTVATGASHDLVEHLAGLAGRLCPALAAADPAHLHHHRRERFRG